MTECQCQGAGWCATLGRKMGAHEAKKCRESEEYRRLFAESVKWTPDMRSRGLGDTITKITHAIGIRQCGGCMERQAALNRLVPY